MPSEENTETPRMEPGHKLVHGLTFGLVVVGPPSAMPGLSGLDDGLKSFAAGLGFIFRKVPFENYYPILFTEMTLMTMLQCFNWRTRFNQTRARWALGMVFVEYFKKPRVAAA